jgi:hypothetical protein
MPATKRRSSMAKDLNGKRIAFMDANERIEQMLLLFAGDAEAGEAA